MLWRHGINIPKVKQRQMSTTEITLGDLGDEHFPRKMYVGRAQVLQLVYIRLSCSTLQAPQHREQSLGADDILDIQRRLDKPSWPVQYHFHPTKLKNISTATVS